MIYAARNRRSPAVVGDAFGYCLQGAAGSNSGPAGRQLDNLKKGGVVEDDGQQKSRNGVYIYRIQRWVVGSNTGAFLGRR